VSRDPHRDPTTDRLIAAALRPRETGGAACVEAETLAAWADGALDVARAAALEAHLAECARCQAMMASFAATDPRAALEANTATPAAAAGPAVVLPMRPRSPMRWLVPAVATAAAASLLLWTAWPAFRSATLAPAPESTMAVASPQAAAEAAAPPPSAAPAPSSVPPPSPARERAQTASVKPKFEARRETLPVGSVQGGAAGIPGAVLLPPAPPPAAAPPAAVPAQTNLAGRQARGSITVVAQSDLVRTDTAIPPVTPVEFGPPPAPLPRADARRAAGGGRGGAGMAIAERPATGIRWRVLSSGKVERSTTGGSSWMPVEIEPPAIVTNGAAPSAEVCWLVGRGGLVLRAIDGTKFERIVFPETVDLTSVAASSALSVEVVTGDGRKLRSTDGGKTWRQDF
jgi:hypothetical protein